MMFPGEKEAIETVRKLGAAYGYGNLIEHLKKAWREILPTETCPADIPDDRYDMAAAAYVFDRAHQYKPSSGSHDALCCVSAELKAREHIRALRHGELDDILARFGVSASESNAPLLPIGTEQGPK